jgi:hypothetical protein
MRETFFVGSHCPRRPKALVSPSAATLYSAVIDLRPESRETDRSGFALQNPMGVPASREMLRHRMPTFRVLNQYRDADRPTSSASRVYQNFGWPIAKSTSRNVQVKVATVCDSPPGVGLTLIVQARLKPLLKPRRTPPAEIVTNGDSK